MRGVEEVERKKFDRKRFWVWFHWVGFYCLFLIFPFFILRSLVIFLDPQSMFPYDMEIPPFFRLQVLFYEFFSFNLNSLVNWLAITHYPIKRIVTGNKSFFPWKS